MSGRVLCAVPVLGAHVLIGTGSVPAWVTVAGCLISAALVAVTAASSSVEETLVDGPSGSQPETSRSSQPETSRNFAMCIGPREQIFLRNDLDVQDVRDFLWRFLRPGK